MNYEIGVTTLFAKNYLTEKSTEIILKLNFHDFQLLRTSSICFGGGVTANFLHWYIGLFKFENLETLWVGTNFEPFSSSHKYISLYYLFDEYNQTQIIDPLPGSRLKNKLNITQTGKYLKGAGIQMFPKSTMRIEGELAPIISEHITQISFIFSLSLTDLPQDLILFTRGNYMEKKEGSFIFLLMRRDRSSFVATVRFYITNSAGKIELQERVSSYPFTESTGATVQVSFAVGPHDTLFVGLYGNGISEFFPDIHKVKFNLSAGNRFNEVLFSEDQRLKPITLYSFRVLDTTGNLLYPVLSYLMKVIRE